MKKQENSSRTQPTRRGPILLKNLSIAFAILLLCLFHAPPAEAATVNATADVNLYTTYQQIEGFGGAICYDVYHMATYPTREAVYNLLFRDLGLDILRIKNTYQISASDVNYTARIVEAGKLRNPALKTFLLPWSPPANLKNTGTVGCNPDIDPEHCNGTLKQDVTDLNNSAPYYYVYKMSMPSGG
jgi:O-glycosyl hydrolase